MGSSYTPAEGSFGGMGVLLLALALIVLVVLLVAAINKKANRVRKNANKPADAIPDAVFSASGAAKVEPRVCKSCGAVVKVTNGKTAECEYCGAAVHGE